MVTTLAAAITALMIHALSSATIVRCTKSAVEEAPTTPRKASAVPTTWYQGSVAATLPVAPIEATTPRNITVMEIRSLPYVVGKRATVH